MLVVNELEVSIAFSFYFLIHYLENTQPTYHKHGSLNQDIFQRKEKSQVSTQYHERGDTYNLTTWNVMPFVSKI